MKKTPRHLKSDDKTLILITALINLISALINLISKLLD